MIQRQMSRTFSSEMTSSTPKQSADHPVVAGVAFCASGAAQSDRLHWAGNCIRETVKRAVTTLVRRSPDQTCSPSDAACLNSMEAQQRFRSPGEKSCHSARYAEMRMCGTGGHAKQDFLPAWVISQAVASVRHRRFPVMKAGQNICALGTKLA